MADPLAAPTVNSSPSPRRARRCTVAAAAAGLPSVTSSSSSLLMEALVDGLSPPQVSLPAASYSSFLLPGSTAFTPDGSVELVDAPSPQQVFQGPPPLPERGREVSCGGETRGSSELEEEERRRRRRLVRDREVAWEPILMSRFSPWLGETEKGATRSTSHFVLARGPRSKEGPSVMGLSAQPQRERGRG